MKNCLGYLKHYKKEIILGPFFKLLEAILELMIPLLMARIIDVGIPEENWQSVVVTGSLIILSGLLGLGFSLICQYYASKAANGFGSSLRQGVFHHITHLSHQELDQMGQGNLVNIMTHDITQLQNTVNMFIRLVVRAPFLLLGSLVCAFILSWKAGLIFLAVIPLIVLVMWLFTKPASKRYLVAQQKLDRLSTLNEEHIAGARVIRAFHQEEHRADDYQQWCQSYRQETTRIARFTSFLNPLTYVIIQAGILAIIYFGAIEVNVGSLSSGEVVALVNYMNQILLALLVISNLVVLFTKGLAAYRRLNHVLNQQSSIVNGEHQATKDYNDALLTFDRVTFYYPTSENAVLEDISFSIKHGETTGIIGGTGSGKSSILSLIERFYDVRSGQISFQGYDLHNWNLTSLRDEIGLVDQKARLFRGTIRSNLLVANPAASEEEMWQALEGAKAATFVKAYADGLDHLVEENGSNYSGGQRQRLTIARAILKKPTLLLLDDATSALDYVTDKEVRTFLRSQKDLTTLIVTQRITSIMHADWIIVIDAGHIVDQGRHEDLLARSAVYQEIYQSQTREGSDSQ